MEFPTTPAGILSAAIILVSQAVSLLYLAIVAFEYRRLIKSRSLLLSAMNADGVSKAVKSKKFLLLLYIIVSVLACILVDYLFFFRPHIL